MIKRDGFTESLWQHSANVFIPQDKILEKKYDVIIAGGGITGISTALLLQNQKFNCLVLESNSLCFGTTSGSTAHINTLMDTSYDKIIKNFGEENTNHLASIIKKAVLHIKENINHYKIDCDYQEAEAFLFSQNDEQTKELETIKNGCDKVNVPSIFSKALPWNFDFQKALKISGQAKFNPVKYVLALATEFENIGGTIIQKNRVINHSCEKDIITGENYIQVETDAGKKYNSKNLVFATHIPPGVNILHLRCTPYRSYALAAKLNDGNGVKDLLYDMYDPYHYYRIQQVKNEYYLIAGGEDHKTAQEPNTEKCFLKLQSHVRKHFDVKEITHKWSSQYYESADGLPYIGLLPETAPSVYVATGFGGNGITYGTVAAIVLSEMIVAGKSKYINLFNPSRIKPVAGFKNFLKENVNVAKQLLEKLFSHPPKEIFSAIAKNGSSIIKYENHTIAVHKDAEGNLHIVSPVCTHMKCNVAWNEVEKSWDCPCHGARYDADGNVLNCPADRPLSKIPLYEYADNN